MVETTESRPVTDAGKALLQMHCHFDRCAGMRGPNDCDCGLESGIVAIEREAFAIATTDIEGLNTPENYAKAAILSLRSTSRDSEVPIDHGDCSPPHVGRTHASRDSEVREAIDVERLALAIHRSGIAGCRVECEWPEDQASPADRDYATLLNREYGARSTSDREGAAE